MRVVFCLRHRAPERCLYSGRIGKLPVSQWAYPPLVLNIIQCKKCMKKKRTSVPTHIPSEKVALFSNNYVNKWKGLYHLLKWHSPETSTDYGAALLPYRILQKRDTGVHISIPWYSCPNMSSIVSLVKKFEDHSTVMNLKKEHRRYVLTTEKLQEIQTVFDEGPNTSLQKADKFEILASSNQTVTDSSKLNKHVLGIATNRLPQVDWVLQMAPKIVSLHYGPVQ